MTDLARLVVKLEAQSAQLTKELQTATRKIDTFEKGVKSAVGRVKSAFSGFAAGFAGAFSVGAITQFAKATIDMADEVNRASQVVGLSTEVFSGLQYAAKQAGVETATFQTSLTKLSKTAVDAADGTGNAADAFKALGVSVKGADGSLKSIDQLLLETAEAFSQYGDSAEKTAAAQAIFGKSGAELLPFLNEGRAGIEALTAEAERLGLVISSDAAKAADQFNDTMDRLKGAVGGAALGVIQKLLPSLNGLATLAADSATESSALTAVMDGLAVAFKAVASAAIVVGNTFQLVGKAAGGFAAVIVTALQGDFKRAMDVYNEMAASMAEDVRDIGEGIAATWHGAAKEVDLSAKSMRESNKKLGFMEAGDEAKKSKKKIDEYSASLESARAIAEEVERIEKAKNEVLQEAAAVYDATRTPLENLNKELERLNQLRNTFIDGKPLIDGDTYTRAVKQAQDGFDEISKKSKKTTDEMSEFAKEAARNMQDAFADFLFDPFSKGLDGMLSDFADVLQRMAAEAAAAQIFDSLGMGAKGGGFDWGGLLGSIGSGVSGLFGGFGMSSSGTVTTANIGTADTGGWRSGGEPQMIGTGAQPELFIPDRSGTFYPRDEWMGKSESNFYITVPITAPTGTVNRQTLDQVSSAALSGAQRSQARNR